VDRPIRSNYAHAWIRQLELPNKLMTVPRWVLMAAAWPSGLCGAAVHQRLAKMTAANGGEDRVSGPMLSVSLGIWHEIGADGTGDVAVTKFSPRNARPAGRSDATTWSGP